MEEKRAFNERITVTQEGPNHHHPDLSVEKTFAGANTKNRKNFLVFCSKLHDFDHKFAVKFNSFNEPDHQLISPVNASITLAVSCKIPKSFQIFLLKEDEPFFEFNSAKLQNFNNIHAKNMEAYEFQVWAFDVLNSPFYNFSSLEIKWTVTKNPEVAFENLTYELATSLS